VLMDDLEDAYEVARSMGDFGEATAEAYQFTRTAVKSGAFRAEITPITMVEKAGPRRLENDEHKLKVDPAKNLKLTPAFRSDGTITPAASSANADVAGALILARRSLDYRGHRRIASSRSCSPRPDAAIRKLLEKVGWSLGDVDLFEINEAFAVVPMTAQRDLGIPSEKININDGACAWAIRSSRRAPG
jgi:acetyl-CoA C-acetyltransferase